MSDPIVIVSYKRTALGAFCGALSSLKAPELGGHAIRGALSTLPSNIQVDEVIMGCVLMAGVGQAPARQAAIFGGLPVSVPCTTVNKVCGSGMQSIMYAYNSLQCGVGEIYIAGGMESMSNAPYYIERNKQRFGHSRLLDHMVAEGLEDAYSQRVMGDLVEDVAESYGFHRNIQDEFALNSVLKARKSTEILKNEIIPIVVSGKDPISVDTDECPSKAKPEKIPTLKPAFKKDGSITAASSSAIADGAAVLVMMRAKKAEQLGLKPIAKIVSSASHAQDPSLFVTAPVGAMRKALALANWSVDSVDLFEINEAFAVAALAAIKDLHIDPNKVNVHGGACSIGHPLGASGARIVVTLLNAMQTHQAKRGVASLCIGGGEGIAIALETI